MRASAWRAFTVRKAPKRRDKLQSTANHGIGYASRDKRNDNVLNPSDDVYWRGSWLRISQKRDELSPLHWVINRRPAVRYFESIETLPYIEVRGRDKG